MKVSDHLRALLILIHLCVVLIAVTPRPYVLSDETALEQTFVAESESWAVRLRHFGYTGSASDLRESLKTLSQFYAERYHSLYLLLRPYLEYFGTQQSCATFVAVHHFPSYPVIEVERGGNWEELYRARSPTSTWHRELFDHSSMRLIFFLYQWPDYREDYESLMRYLVHKITTEVPNVSAVRITYIERALFPYATDSSKPRYKDSELRRYESKVGE